MQPLKRPRRTGTRKRSKAVAELEEYERLLSQSFTTDDPDAPQLTQQQVEAVRNREKRIQELHQRLFGPQIALPQR